MTERERELRREGGKSLLAYVKGVDPYNRNWNACLLGWVTLHSYRHSHLSDVIPITVGLVRALLRGLLTCRPKGNCGGEVITSVVLLSR